MRTETITKGLDDKSRVPIGWVFAILSCSGSALIVAVGVGLYTGRIESEAKAQAQAIQEIKNKQSDSDNILRIIDERLSRMEGRMDLPRGRHLIFPPSK